MKLENIVLLSALCGFQPNIKGKLENISFPSFVKPNFENPPSKKLNEKRWTPVQDFLFTNKISGKTKLGLVTAASVAAYILVPGVESLTVGLVCPVLGTALLMGWISLKIGQFLAGKLLPTAFDKAIDLFAGKSLIPNTLTASTSTPSTISSKRQPIPVKETPTDVIETTTDKNKELETDLLAFQTYKPQDEVKEIASTISPEQQPAPVNGIPTDAIETTTDKNKELEKDVREFQKFSVPEKKEDKELEKTVNEFQRFRANTMPTLPSITMNSLERALRLANHLKPVDEDDKRIETEEDRKLALRQEIARKRKEHQAIMSLTLGRRRHTLAKL